MKLQRYQHGASMYGIVFAVLLGAMFVHTLFKLLPPYMESMAIRSVVQSVEKDVETNYTRPSQVHQAITRRFGINNIRDFDNDAISVVRDGDYFLIDIVYEVRTPYIANISLVMEFEHQGQVRAR